MQGSVIERVERLTAADYEELIAFLDTCFGEASPSFRLQAPGNLQPTDASLGMMRAIRRQGRLAAVAGLFPRTLIMGEQQLAVSGVGCVATAPRWRGEGLMTELMEHLVAASDAARVPVSALGGHRQRYRRWGYEICGQQLQVQMTAADLRQGPGKLPSVTLEPAGPGDLTTLQALHETQPLRVARKPELHLLRLRNWQCEPWLALDEDGIPVGYLSGRREDGLVSELVADEVGHGLAILRDWQALVEQPLSLSLPPLPTPLNQAICELAEAVQLVPSANWRLHDWAPVVEAALELRHQLQPLPEGGVTMGLLDGPSYALRVDGDRASCTPFGGEPEVRLDAWRLSRLLFGPTPPSLVMELPPAAGLLQSWCPLPLWLPKPDRC